LGIRLSRGRKKEIEKKEGGKGDRRRTRLQERKSRKKREAEELPSSSCAIESEQRGIILPEFMKGKGDPKREEGKPRFRKKRGAPPESSKEKSRKRN